MRIKFKDPFLMSNPDSFYKNSAGLIVPKTCLPEKHLIAMDFFSGVGGFSCGLIDAGINVIAAVEQDIAAVYTYTINLGAYPLKMIFVEESDRERATKYFEKMLTKTKDGVLHMGVSGNNRHRVCPPWFKGVKYIFIGDVRKLTSQRIMDEIGIKPGDLDIIVGGPPCQGFSTLGKRNVMDERNSLVFEYARFICELQPKTMAMENVPNIVNMFTPDGIPVVDAFCRILEDGRFGTMDIVKRSLIATAGVGVALKNRSGNKTKIKKHLRKNKEGKTKEQLEMFS